MRFLENVIHFFFMRIFFVETQIKLVCGLIYSSIFLVLGGSLTACVPRHQRGLKWVLLFI